jgi:zinc D-Ala-D-Ala carboxypeptidase
MHLTKHIVCFFLSIGCFFIYSNNSASAASMQNEKQLAQHKDIMKLEKVLSVMSPRAKAAIPNGDPQEFLSDLNTVLSADKDNLLVLCDKTHALGKDYVTAGIVPLVKNNDYAIGRNNLSLRRVAEQGLRIMAKAARADDTMLLISSSYRSYQYQVTVYNRLVAQEGQAVADRESARPGTSQHQLGTAVDFGSISDEYAQTKAGKWLSANAEKYGWSLSFPQGYEDITGYRWECWHYRYIGVDACRFQKKWFGDIQQFMLEFIHAWKAEQ